MIISSKEQKLSPLLKYPGGKDKELIHILPNLPKNAQNYYEPFVGGGAVFFAINAKRYFINDKSFELMQLYSLVKDGDTDFLDKISQIDHNWNIIGSIVNNHAEEISIIYYSYKNNKFSKQKLYDEIAAFVLHNSAEFNGLLSPNFNIGIQNFVNELSKSFRNKIVRMVEIERKKGNLSKEDFLLNIECAFKSAFYMHFRYLYNNAEELGISSSFYIAIYFYIREFCYSSMFRYNNNGKFN
ncbi:MAG: DNA adenine methylase, partial [Oscillospiraceae bacterium]